MSGGSLDYFCYEIERHAGDLGDRELDDLVKDMAELFHDREWYLSGDTGEGDWAESRDRFKKKWFTPIGRSERIGKYLDMLRNDVMKSFGLSERYCRNCRHWTPEDKVDAMYGTCEFADRCLMHRSESCERFDRK